MILREKLIEACLPNSTIDGLLIYFLSFILFIIITKKFYIIGTIRFSITNNYLVIDVLIDLYRVVIFFFVISNQLTNLSIYC